MQAIRSHALYFFLLFVVFSIVLSLSIPLAAQNGEAASPLDVRPQDRVTSYINDAQRTTLTGNRHPLALPANEAGSASPDMRMDRMILSLRPSAAQQSALQALLQAQQDPNSPYYHEWLTPETYAERFGVSDNDMQQIVSWLHMHGMTVEAVASSGNAIVFSGTAGQVEETFQTPIKMYQVNGQLHYANASDPQIPQALAEVVNGPVSLHDFHSAPSHVDATPAYTAGNGGHFLTPADFATIYDVGPLYSQGLDGTGQTIAVLGRADITLTDIEGFRNDVGLPAKDPQIMVNGVDPGFPGCSDELESTMDVELAGAIAKNANIIFVTSKSTTTTDGIQLSAQYAVTNNVAPIITMSYGLCETMVGTAGNAAWNALWAEAAGQGQTVFVSSMDDGAAGCDNPDLATATQGQAVSGLCSTPYTTCVGGSQFDDTYNPQLYWAATNGAGMSSALGYIPESAWNESGVASDGLYASGGGKSTLYNKPTWQAAPGVPPDGKRDIPDVALMGSIHDAYVLEFQGSRFYGSGTSAATPSMASIIALVLQNNNGTPMGNINPILYGLATKQLSSGGAAVFHDITSGNNTVPGVTGFSAGVGYDMVTGLGSVDAQLLVNHWNDSSANPNIQLSAAKSSVSLATGATGTAAFTVAASGGFSSSVALSVAGLPAKLTGTFSPATLTAPGSGTSTLTLAATTGLAAGTYPLVISAVGGNLTRKADLSVTVGTAGGLTLTPSANQISLPPGNSGHITLTTAPTNGLSSSVTLAVAGMPTGMTASFSPTTIAAPGSGTSTLTVATASGAVHGNYTLTLNATGGGVTQTSTLTVDVPDFVLQESALTTTVAPSSSSQLTFTTVPISAFSAAVAFSVSGLPSGVTAAFSPASLAAPGLGSSLLTLTATSAATLGTFTPTVTVTGGNVTHTQVITLTVAKAPTFTFTPSTTTLNILAGSTGSMTFTTAAANGFNSAVGFTIAGLPSAGATKIFAPTTIAAPGSGTTTLSLSMAAGVRAGSYPLTITATGGGVTKIATVTLNVPGIGLDTSAGLTVSAGVWAALQVVTTATAGFNSAVTLSITGLPSGVTASFAPANFAAPGAGSSLLSFTTAASAVAGQSTLTITATGGGVTQTLPVTLTVKLIPSFTLAASASAGGVKAGATGDVPITTAPTNGFNSAIVLTVSGLPAGVTAAFTPATIAAPGSGTSQLALTLGANVAAGSYPLTITATGGGVTQTCTFTLSVKGFTLTGPATAQVRANASAQLSIATTALGGFDSSIALSVTGLPSNITANFSSATVAAPGSGSTTLAFMANVNAAYGTYPLTLTAVGGGLTKTLPIALTVINPSFTLTGSQSSATVIAGGSGGATFTTADVSEFNSAIGFTITGLPAGATAAFAPSTIAAPGAGSTKLNLTVASTTALGSYPLTITATGGGVTKTATLTLIVPSFALSSPASVTLLPGGNQPVSIMTGPLDGFNAAISLSISGLPKGVTAAFAPATIAAPGSGTSWLTITASQAAIPETYPLTLTAVGYGITKTATISLTISAASFTLTASQSSGNFVPGGSGSITFTTAAVYGFNSLVAVAVTGMPFGTTAAFTPATIAAPGSGTSILAFTLPSTVLPGTYPLTITANGNGIFKTLTFTLNVPSFILETSTSVKITAGLSMPLVVLTTAEGGFNSSIALSITGLPSGVTAAFSPATFAAPGSGYSSLTVTVASSVKAGTYPLTVTAVGGGLTKTSAITLTVAAP
jgi:subtilase family serine protease